MEQEKDLGTEQPLTPTTNVLAPDVDCGTASACDTFNASNTPKTPLPRRLADAFQEGVTSVRPDTRKQPEVEIPTPARKKPCASGETGVMKRVLREGGASAAVVGEKAAGLLDSMGQWVKNAPDLLNKYTEAFREGVASVTQQRGLATTKDCPSCCPPARKREASPAAGKAILEKATQTGESMAGLLRNAFSAVGAAGQGLGAQLKIRNSQNKIGKLHLELGREAVRVWGQEILESEKVSRLLDAVNKQEEEIRNLRQQLDDMAAERKARAVKSPSPVKEVVSETTPPAPSEPATEPPSEPPSEAALEPQTEAGIHPVEQIATDVTIGADIEPAPIATSQEIAGDVSVGEAAVQDSPEDSSASTDIAAEMKEEAAIEAAQIEAAAVEPNTESGSPSAAPTTTVQE